MAQSYSINDLERLTGIRAHTIRIWERRYNLLSPARTDTNIRTYQDDDLRKILNVSTLLKAGWKISHIGALSTQELESEVWQSANTTASPEHVYEVYVQALVSAALSFDEAWFESAFAEVLERFGLPTTMQEVIGPFLNRVGLMWSVIKLHPGQEHFASNLVRRKLFKAIDELPLHQTKGTCLLFLPEWEEHEIGLLYAWYLLRAAGYHVIYLGQRVPIEALIQTIEVVNPSMLLTFLVSEDKEETVNAYVSKVVEHYENKPFYIAMRSDMNTLVFKSDQVQVINSPQAFIELIKRKD